MEKFLIISLTTLPSRYNSLKQCLESLLNQNYSNYEIHLNIPKKNQFEGPYTHKLDYNNDKLKIFYIDDIGSISKIYYTLKRIEDRNQRIITVDDDIIYDKDMLFEYNRVLDKYNDSCIGFAGIQAINNKGEYKHCCIGPVKTPTSVGILEGYKSVCYKRDFFSDDFFICIIKKDMLWAYNEIFIEDDVIISSYLGYKNIKKIIIPPKIINENDNIPRCISFPIIRCIANKKSGCFNNRLIYGSTAVNIEKFYKSKFGKYIL